MPITVDRSCELSWPVSFLVCFSPLPLPRLPQLPHPSHPHPPSHSLFFSTTHPTHGVKITLSLRQNDVATSFWCNNNAIFTSCIRCGCLTRVLVDNDAWSFQVSGWLWTYSQMSIWAYSPMMWAPSCLFMILASFHSRKLTDTMSFRVWPHTSPWPR